MSLDVQAESLARISEDRTAHDGTKKRTRMSTILSKKSADELYQPGVPRPGTEMEIDEQDEQLE